MANLTLCKNPFRPQIDREEVFVRAGTRLDTVLRNQGLISGRGKTLHRRHTFVVMLNGQWLMQEQWARRVKSEDSIGVLFVPGKGGGGSNPMQVVAMVALAAATAGVGALAAGAWGVVAGAAVSAGMMLVGGLLMSVLFPPAKPPSAMAREQASPTYTIGAQGNTARLMESIPVQYGRFRAYPDFAAQPYTELSGNETYLYQLFCLGQGEYDIEEIRIEDTPISNFAEVQYEVIPPGGAVTLFPDNVVTSSAVQGLELKGTNENGHAAIGPFVANPAGTTTTKIAIDIVLPAGLFYANDRGDLDARTVTWTVRAHPIDDAGEPTGVFFTLGEETFSAGTNTPQMMTYRYDVPEGRYSVSVVRTSSKDASSRAGNTLQWGGLRAYLPDHRDYGDVTLIAMIIRATNNLNQSTARRVNVISTRKLKTWHPGNGWSFGVSATRNPAWAIADACRNPIYGRGLADSRINLQALYRLSRIWDERGDRCDGVFDTATTLWDALTQMARTGRAMPMYYAGIIDFIRNEPKTVKTLMFTPNNIISNSFSVDYVFPQHDSPDYIIVEFFNEETWQPDEVECVLPGSAKKRPYRLQMPMVANRAQAWREGMSLAAQIRDQRRFVTFQTEMEGHIPRYGDLVEISHDVPAWGLSGLIESYSPSTKRLITSEPLKWWAGEHHYITLRKRDGSPDGPYRVFAGAHEREMVIADAIDGHDVFVSNGQGEDFTHYQFGPGERRSLLAQVISTQPDESGNVTIDFVNYAPSVHSAENGGVVPPPNSSSLLPSMPNAPVIDSVIVYPTAVTGQQIISATPARGAEHYEFRASNNDGQTWLDLGLHEKPSITVSLAVGAWRVQVRGIGVMHGPWASWVGPVSATMAPPPVLTHLSTKPLHWGLQLNWAWPSGINLTHIEIWISQTPNFLDAALLGLFPYPQTKHELGSLSLTSRLWFWARVRDEANQAGLWFPSESAAGVLGHPINDAQEYNDLVPHDLIANGLGDLIMGNILDIPNIRDTAGNALAETGQQAVQIADNAQAIAKEIIDRGNAVAAESQARIDGQVVAAQALADGLTAEAQARGAAITTEKMERQAADASLAGQINTVTTAVGDNAAAIRAEEQARASGDSAEANARQTLAVQVRGDYSGSDVNQVSTGLIGGLKRVVADNHESVVQQMSQLQAGIGEQFDYAKMWYWEGNREGWSGSVIDGSWLRPVDSVGYVVSPRGLDVNGAEYPQVRLRLKKVGNPAWNPIVGLYAPGATGGYYTMHVPAQPDWDENGIGVIVFTHTHQGIIDGIILRGTHATLSPDNYYAFDWFAIGRPAPGASTAALNNEAKLRATADIAEATSRETLSVKLIGKADPTGVTLPNVTSGLIFDERQARVSGDEAAMTEITGLKARMPAGTGKVATEASVAGESQVRAAADSALAGRSAALEARMPVGTGKVATADAVDSLTTAVQRNDQAISTESQRVTSLSNTVGALAGAAGNLLLDSNAEIVRSGLVYLIGKYRLSESFVPNEKYTLVTCVSHSGAAGTAVGVWVGGSSQNAGEVARAATRSIKVTKFTKNSSNLSPRDLQFYFTPSPGNQAGEATIHWAALYKGDVVPPLDWQASDVETVEAIAANATAIQATSTKVEQLDGKVTSQGQAVTSLSNTINHPQTGLQATADALNQTNTKLDGTEKAVINQQNILQAGLRQLYAEEDAELDKALALWDSYAAIAETRQIVATEVTAMAEIVDIVKTSLGGNSAAVQETLQALVELEGKMLAQWGINVQLNVGGVPYIAGTSLGIVNEGGVTRSAFNVLADMFNVMHDVNGQPKAVFSVQGGAAIINTALIGSASITDAHIANGSITRAKIANAAIGNAQIENGVITSAKIGSAQINNAHIINASVDTLKVAGNSITVTAVASAPAQITTASSRSTSVGMYLPAAAKAVVTVNVSDVFGNSQSLNYHSVINTVTGAEILKFTTSGVFFSQAANNYIVLGGQFSVVIDMPAGNVGVRLVQPRVADSFSEVFVRIESAMR
ncbi:host specificity factor TipJ family phage tail protein [Alcaligenes endophyticus]|uniref:DUF1983 domain-containing protein n=1 Tax=Alcaligenes endophyticus TaxID=1929088 RepID=A0ABT8EK89_9BURK|nr:host specificity factor TipJ family phage tail protein [Alcaligenes endophyticus]MCX5592018.1 host specificity factor TipJ family phage tail protein [Alcaligenes endophyticus]MDN4121708.1 DUF1983 domain-containing protein [Alcaligenes endophyticus]